MKSREALIWFSTLGMAVLLVADAVRLQAQQPLEEAVKKADIIFTGEVIQTGATSMRGVPKTDLIIEMVVADVLEKPPAIQLAPGDHVTVLTRDVSPFKVGRKATVYANGWILGEHLAVREVAHVLLHEGAETLGADEDRSTLERIRVEVADRDLLERAEAADLIVVGKVVAVNMGTLESASPDARTTEHDPEWTDATIEIQSSIKGSPDSERVVVRFPASQDVAWYKAPKFSVGQEGTFLLNRAQISTGPGLVMENIEPGTFTALQQEAVLPRDQAERIRRLLQEQ